MELLVLILVNFVTAGIMYALFAIRFRVSVEKARRAPIMQDLRENIEAAIEYIGTSIELMDRKNRSFQQAVTQAQRVAERLEAALLSAAEAPARPPRRKRSPKGGAADVASDDQAASTVPEAGPRAPSPASSAGSGRSQSAAPLTPPPTADAMERLLSRLGSDRFSMSDLGAPAEGSGPGASEEVDAPAERSAGERMDHTASAAAARWSGLSEETVVELPASRAGRGLGFVGSLISRIFGMKSARETSDLLPRATAPARPKAPIDFGVALSREQARARDPDDQQQASVSGVDLSSLSNRAGDRVQISPEAVAAIRPGKAPTGGPAGTESPSRNAEVQVEHTRAAPAVEERPARSPLSEWTAAPEADNEPAYDPLGEPVPAAPGERREHIRNLLGRGFSPDRISAATGITRAEIELVALLPAHPSRLRKLRHREQ